jgi:hypothetical protein
MEQIKKNETHISNTHHGGLCIHVRRDVLTKDITYLEGLGRKEY